MSVLCSFSSHIVDIVIMIKLMLCSEQTDNILYYHSLDLIARDRTVGSSYY